MRRFWIFLGCTIVVAAFLAAGESKAGTVLISADEAKLPLEVAKLQLSRTDFSNPQPGAEHIKALKAAAPILLDEQLVRPGTDVAQVVDQLIQPQLAAQVIGSNVAKVGN